MRKDIEHLKLLALFHYITAGLTAVFSFFPLIYVFLGVMFLVTPMPAPPPVPPGGMAQPGPTGPPPFLGWMFIVGGSFFMLLLIAFAVAQGIAGRCLTRRKAWTFCLVIAIFNCLTMSLPTILGVFTIVVLFRENVKDLFAGKYIDYDPEEDEEHDLRLPEYRRRAEPDDRRFYSPPEGER
jgi:hypothetical protein